jgi:hypothetical protein
MFRPIVELAISKASCDLEVAALNSVLEAAIALDEEERTIGDRIDANKALRGEGPTRLSKRTRSEVDSYASDADAFQAQQLEEFAGFERSSTIIACLAPGLQADVAFWQSNCTKAHPSDVPLIQQFASKKETLCKAMGSYLSVYGRDDC